MTGSRIGDARKAMKLTAVFRKVPEGYIAFVEELPGANTQGATLDEARRNSKRRLRWYLRPTVASLRNPSRARRL